MFTILDKFSLSFESDILVNYIKRREYTKFDELIKRFLILSKEPIRSNSYFILLNCILWTDDVNGTLFDYVLNGEILSEKYSKKDLLESLLSLNGHYYNSECKSEYIQFTPHIEATLKRNNYEIYRTLLYSKNQRNCLIYSIASYGSSNRQLSFLLKDKNQLKILASLSSVKEKESPLERIIQDIDGINNNTIKQIIDKYLDLDIELRVPIRLNSKSIEFLAKRNEASLFKIVLDNTQVLDQKSSDQLVNFNNFKLNLRNSTNQCLKIALEQNNERIAELLIDKIINLNINDYKNQIIEYETLAKLFEMKWWTEIEKIFDSFCLPPMSFSSLNQENLEIVVQNDQISNVSESNQSLSEKLSNLSKTPKEYPSSSYENASNKSKEATENSNLDAQSESKNLELNYLLNESVETEEVGYQKVSQVDPDSVQNDTSVQEKTFNFICIESYKDYPEIYKGEKEHFLMKKH